MTTFASRLAVVLALAAIATPALGEGARRPPSGGGSTSYRSHSGQLTAEELSASAGGAPSPAHAAQQAERLAAARKAIDQVLVTLPAARKPG